MTSTAGTKRDGSAKAAGGPARAYALAGLLAAAALVLRGALPGSSAAVPSASVLALVLGLLVGALPGVRATAGRGAGRVTKATIPWAIVLIGFGLDLGPLLRSGSLAAGLGITVALMAVAFLGALLGARALGLSRDAGLLLGAGTAVCGNSAIMAVAPAIDADDDEVGLSIGVINLLGVLMLFALPPLAGALGVAAEEGGALAGLTVHAVPQAIATGGAFGERALEWATLYKLLRVALLVPVVLLVSVLVGRRSGDAPRARVPLFVPLFVAAAVLRGLGWADAEVRVPGLGAEGLGSEGPAPLWAQLKAVGRIALAVALAAIGLGLDLRSLVRVGPRFLLAGLIALVPPVALGLALVRWAV
ncbi:MAG: putative sulfate exporter family transporter [Planctomycetota bacterium]